MTSSEASNVESCIIEAHKLSGEYKNIPVEQRCNISFKNVPRELVGFNEAFISQYCEYKALLQDRDAIYAKLLA